MLDSSGKHRIWLPWSRSKEAKKDKATREKILAKIGKSLDELGDQKGKAHKKSVCALMAHRTMGRYLRQLKDRSIKIDKSKIQEEAHLDGKYIISTCDLRGTRLEPKWSAFI